LRRRVAVLILNGGMATRFGGKPKGVVPVVQNETETFLWIKLAQIARLVREHNATIPVIVMHSFATQSVSRRHLDEIIAGPGVDALGSASRRRASRRGGAAAARVPSICPTAWSTARPGTATRYTPACERVLRELARVSRLAGCQRRQPRCRADQSCSAATFRRSTPAHT
jgi:hypothetical protein